MPAARLRTPDGVLAVTLDRPPCRFPLALRDALACTTMVVFEQATIEKAEDVRVERGISTEDEREYFVSGPDFAGLLLLRKKDQGWTATLSTHKNLLPRVLSDASVRDGIMPAQGESGLPESLAKVVPLSLRYWDMQGEAARVARDKLVSSGLFLENLIKVVDGQMRLCVERLFLFEPDEAQKNHPPEARFDAIKRVTGLSLSSQVIVPFEAAGADWRGAIAKATAESVILIGCSERDQIVEVCEALKAAPPPCPFFIMHDDSDLARFAMGEVGRLFKLDDDASGDLYLFSNPLADVRRVQWQDLPIEFAKAVWTTAYVNDLPDSAFLHIAPGGEKDEQGKTKPRSLRYFPIRDKDGAIDEPHLRNALSRIPQANIPQEAKDKARAEAERLLAEISKACGDGKKKKPALKEGEEALSVKRLVRKAEEAATVEERYVLGVVLEPDVKDAQNDIYSADEVRTACHKYMEEYRGLGLMHEKDAAGKVVILECYVAPCDFSIGEEAVKAGTWLMGFGIRDDDLWSAVKSGEYTGLSIGGSAVRKPAS